MKSWVVVDANLLLLVVIGRAGPTYIQQHKRLRDKYTASDYGRVDGLVKSTFGVVVVPQVLAEVSNFARHIGEPARAVVMAALGRLIQSSEERWVQSSFVAEAQDFLQLGLTDAILIHLCSGRRAEESLTLLTADWPLASRARSLGCNVVNYREL